MALNTIPSNLLVHKAYLVPDQHLTENSAKTEFGDFILAGTQHIPRYKTLLISMGFTGCLGTQYLKHSNVQDKSSVT